MLLLKNCRLVPELTEGYDGRYADIVIDGKNIDKIVPVGTIDIPDATVIDMKNRTILPGFFDLHCHLVNIDTDWNALLVRPPQQMLMNCMVLAHDYLRQGYTTVRDEGSVYYTGPRCKEAVDRGIIQGARIKTAGRILTATTRGNECWGEMYQEVDEISKWLHYCRVEIKNGAEFIKIMATGAVLNKGGDPGAMICTPQEIAAAVDAANTLGTYVSAHCHGSEGIKQAALNGVKTIEHASYLTEECVEAILKKGNKSSLVPTMMVNYVMCNGLGKKQDPTFIAKATDACIHMRESVVLAEKSGLLVGWGTDGDHETMMKMPGIEFRAHKGIGLTNIQILREATINSAKIIGMDDKLGTIKVGKYADLVAIDGNPDEDIDAMNQFPAYVFKEGKQFIDI